MTDSFDLENYRLPPGTAPPITRVEPRKLQKRRKHFVLVPWKWVEALSGASGQTWELATHLLYRHWRNGGVPIKLANSMLKTDGIGRKGKSHALTEMERRGLIAVERSDRKSPIVTLLGGTLNPP